MHQLQFTHAHDYSGEDESVVRPVTLRSGENQISVAASMDTGASFCLFRSEVADFLDLDLTSGIRKRFRTANSAFEAFGHEIELTALGVITYSTVYFFADSLISTNVLVRKDRLARPSAPRSHHDSRIYPSAYKRFHSLT